MQLSIYLLTAIFGGLTGLLLRIPMGTIMGAMLFVGLAKAFSIITLEPTSILSFLVQISLGTMIGLSFTKLTKSQLKQIRYSILFIVISVILTTIVTGLVVSRITPISTPIAILSSAPGGMVEMATMAVALNLAAPLVIFLHFIRLLLVMIAYPYLIKYISVKSDGLEGDRSPETIPSISDPNEKINNRKLNNGVKFLLLISTAFIGGLIGYLSGFPIGALLGALLFVSTLKIASNQYQPLPTKVKRSIQIFIGANIGLSITHETFLMLPKLILPGLLITLLIVLFSIVLAFLMTRLLKMDLLTAVCGLAPAGMSEMVIIAESYNINLPTVISLHLFRIVTIISCVPFIVKIFL